MTDLLTLQPEPPPPLPSPIEEYLRHFTRRGKRVRRRLKFLTAFVQKENGTSRPDEKTFALLQSSVKAYDPRRWREAVLSAWALGKANLTEAQSEKAVKNLSAVLDDKGETKSIRQSMSVIWTFVQIVLWGGGGIVLSSLVNQFLNFVFCGGEHGCGLMPVLFVVPTLLPVVAAVIGFIVTLSDQKEGGILRREEVGYSLASLGKAEGIPALLRASQDARFLDPVGRATLKHILPSLKFEEHYRALGEEVVPDLCRLLKQSVNAGMMNVQDYQSLLLAALAEIGDSRAIQPLEKFERHLQKRKHSAPEVVAQTESVLAILRERDAKETAQLTLLRGSTAPVSPETMLRAYEGTPEAEPEQLLRSSQKDEA